MTYIYFIFRTFIYLYFALLYVGLRYGRKQMKMMVMPGFKAASYS